MAEKQTSGVLIVESDKFTRELMAIHLAQANVDYALEATTADDAFALAKHIEIGDLQVGAVILDGNLDSQRTAGGELLPVEERFDEATLVAQALRRADSKLKLVAFGLDSRVMERVLAENDVKLDGNAGTDFAELPKVLGALALSPAA